MHADEVDTDAALVRRLLTEQFPEWAALPITAVFPRGTDNALYRLGEEMVVRLPRRDRTRVTLEKELRWLPVVAPHLPVAVPMPLAAGEPGDVYPFCWAVYSWLSGERPEGISDSERFASDLARFILAIERIDADGGPPPGPHNFFRGEPLDRRDEATRRGIASLREVVDAEAATAAWEAALAVPGWDRAAVWIHGDLDASNVLLEGDRLSGVIDFGALGVGDPACDVMVAWKLLSPRTRELFRSELGVDDATWERARGWALSQAVGALSYYTLETHPTLVRAARVWLHEVLGDDG